MQGVSAARALAVLETEDPVVFLDIRSANDAKTQGSPDLKQHQEGCHQIALHKGNHEASYGHSTVLRYELSPDFVLFLADMLKLL